MKIIKSRIFKILIALFIVGFFLGIISNLLMNDNNSIINYFSLIEQNKFNYFSSLINSIFTNYKYALIIWISGIVFFLSFIIPFIIVFRGISVGFTICGIICSFKLKGLLYALIFLIPSILINELVYLFLSYYSINFSLKVFNAIKNNKLINIKSFSKNYLYIFLIFLGILLMSSLFEIYITSNIIKFVI